MQLLLQISKKDFFYPPLEFFTPSSKIIGGGMGGVMILRFMCQFNPPPLVSNPIQYRVLQGYFQHF